MTKSSLIPVEGHPNFCRDKNTGAIVNTDSSSFAAYHQRNSQKKMERLTKMLVAVNFRSRYLLTELKN